MEVFAHLDHLLTRNIYLLVSTLHNLNFNRTPPCADAVERAGVH